MYWGWSKVTRSGKMVAKKSKKNLKDWTKWNRKIGGRNFKITNGAFGGTLKYRSWQPDKAGGSARLETSNYILKNK